MSRESHPLLRLRLLHFLRFYGRDWNGMKDGNGVDGAPISGTTLISLAQHGRGNKLIQFKLKAMSLHDLGLLDLLAKCGLLIWFNSQHPNSRWVHSTKSKTIIYSHESWLMTLSSLRLMRQKMNVRSRFCYQESSSRHSSLHQWPWLIFIDVQRNHSVSSSLGAANCNIKEY